MRLQVLIEEEEEKNKTGHPKTTDFELKLMDLVLELMNFVPEMMGFKPTMMDFVLEMMDFVLKHDEQNSTPRDRPQAHEISGVREESRQEDGGSLARCDFTAVLGLFWGCFGLFWCCFHWLCTEKGRSLARVVFGLPLHADQAVGEASPGALHILTTILIMTQGESSHFGPFFGGTSW